MSKNMKIALVIGIPVLIIGGLFLYNKYVKQPKKDRELLEEEISMEDLQTEEGSPTNTGDGKGVVKTGGLKGLR